MALAEKSLVQVINNIVQSILGTAFGVILARSLLPEGLGVYQLYISTAAILTTVGTLGLGQAGLFFINAEKEERRHVLYNLLMVSAALGVLCSLFLVLLTTVASGFFVLVPNWALFLFAAGSGAALLSAIFQYILLADLAVWQICFSGLFSRALPLAIVLCALFGKALQVDISLFAHAVGAITSMVFIWVVLSRKHQFCKTRLDTTLISRMVRYGFPLSIVNCLLILTANASIVLLRLLIPGALSEIGHFGRAVAIANLVILVPGSIGPILYSQWSRSKGKVDVPTLQLATRVNSIVGATLVLGVILMAKPLVLLLYGVDYLPAIPALRILALSCIFKAVMDVWLNLLMSRGETRTIPVVFTLALGILIGTSYLLVPTFGIEGAAISNLVSNLAAALVTFFVLRSNLSEDFPIRGLMIRLSDFAYIRRSARSIWAQS